MRIETDAGFIPKYTTTFSVAIFFKVKIILMNKMVLGVYFINET
jgi:hypothetical protein